MRTFIITVAAMIAMIGLAQYAKADTTKYIKFGCAENGDGSTSACASGGVGAYNTFDAWEGQDANLTGTGKQNVYITCQDCSSADSTASFVSGWTTTSTDYINIVVDSTARHAGIWSTSKYRFSNSYTYGALRIPGDLHIAFDGMQIENTGNGADGDFAIFVSSTAGSGKLTLTNSIVRSAYGEAIYAGNDSCQSYLIYNNLLVTANAVSLRFANTACTYDIHNNTIISTAGTYGIRMEGRTSWASGTAYFKNNLIYGAATTDYQFDQNGSGTLTTSNNATADTSSPNDTYDSQCTDANGADCFVDSTTGNYHLISTADVLNDGADLSGTFTTDIDYQTRTGSWDIGADEYIAPSGTTTTYYVNTNSTAGGDGTTNATTGTNRAFATLTAAEAALQRTIDVGDEVIIMCDGTAADTERVIIDGWTVNGRLTIRGAQSHGGKWNTGIYRFEWAATSGAMSAFHIFENNVTLDNLQLRAYTGTDNPFAAVRCEYGITGLVIINCFVRSSFRGASIGSVDEKIFNNIFINSESWTFGSHGAGTGKKIYNNTIVNTSASVEPLAFNFNGSVGANSISFQNNLVIGNSYAIILPYGTACFTADTGYNVNTGINGTSTHLFPGSNNKFSQTITFVDPANFDYRTTDTDASVANNLYGDSTAPITTDVTGKARPSVGAVFAGAFEGSLKRGKNYNNGYFQGFGIK